MRSRKGCRPAERTQSPLDLRASAKASAKAAALVEPDEAPPAELLRTAKKLGITGGDAEAYSDAPAMGMLDHEHSDVFSKIRKTSMPRA